MSEELEQRLDRLIAAIDTSLAKNAYTPKRPLWVESKPVWERRKNVSPDSAREEAFAQLGSYGEFCDYRR